MKNKILMVSCLLYAVPWLACKASHPHEKNQTSAISFLSTHVENNWTLRKRITEDGYTHEEWLSKPYRRSNNCARTLMEMSFPVEDTTEFDDDLVNSIHFHRVFSFLRGGQCDSQEESYFWLETESRLEAQALEIASYIDEPGWQGMAAAVGAGDVAFDPSFAEWQIECLLGGRATISRFRYQKSDSGFNGIAWLKNCSIGGDEHRLIINSGEVKEIRVVNAPRLLD